MWPLLDLEELTPAATALLRDAMPVIPAAAGSNSSDGVPPDVDALAWLQLWSTKLTRYTHRYPQDLWDLPRCCAILRECIHLTDVDLPNYTSVLEAVTTPAHRVASITTPCIETDTSFLMALGRWLESKHASSLTLEYQHTDHRAAISAALAPMLAKTTSLKRVILYSSAPGVVAPLVAVAPSFKRLKQLDISVDEADKAALVQFLQRLNSAKLSSLRVVCEEMNLSPLLRVLATFLALTFLELRDGYFVSNVLPAAGGLFPPTLRHLVLDSTRFNADSWRVFAAHVPPTCAMIVSLGDWIRRGLRQITFQESYLGDEKIEALATALSHAASPVGVVIDIDDTDLSRSTFVHVDRALATCRGISIALSPLRGLFNPQPPIRYVKHRYEHDGDRVRRIVLESPALTA
ncbi:hypothetical protein SDRG_14908 [Saprolegnia diclina VS20]|uniref:F-box domain-containing protein n=1 Tax=Saprolegnia diclina (strain VS20) TaxID=1156394 RepID=T0RCG4_SAPDV|nr:hypothetical protein SDRG_14908 [Saprolegnia diclina VS20]EQC27287.1 hypothetical protein SDRG_14908 [Saprolegnia diclina VS20]|eukprot:XP_008619290.1 hypothetical protein SDRG_14908 [Saprolegnia diclina VS20]